MTNTTTIKTSASGALTDISQARQAVERAAVELSVHHTRANKLALKQAQAHEEKLTLDYYQWRLARLAAETEKQRRTS